MRLTFCNAITSNEVNLKDMSRLFRDHVIPSTPVIRREKGQKFAPKSKWRPPTQQRADTFVHGNEHRPIIDQDEMFVVLQVKSLVDTRPLYLHIQVFLGYS